MEYIIEYQVLIKTLLALKGGFYEPLNSAISSYFAHLHLCMLQSLKSLARMQGFDITANRLIVFICIGMGISENIGLFLSQCIV